jgi:hypothetical protein
VRWLPGIGGRWRRTSLWRRTPPPWRCRVRGRLKRWSGGSVWPCWLEQENRGQTGITRQAGRRRAPSPACAPQAGAYGPHTASGSELKRENWGQTGIFCASRRVCLCLCQGVARGGQGWNNASRGLRPLRLQPSTMEAPGFCFAIPRLRWPSKRGADPLPQHGQGVFVG